MAAIHDVMPVFQLYQPASVDEALGLLDRFGARAWTMAGGLDTFDWLKDRIKRTEAVVELGEVAELRGIKEVNGGLEIGATTTLTEVANHPIVKQRFGVLAQAAGLVASPQIRHQGTLGGNVSQDARCWYYRSGWPCYRAGGNICYADTPTAINREHAILNSDRCVAVSPSDTAPALVALDATVVIRRLGGERVVSAREYFVGPSYRHHPPHGLGAGRTAHGHSHPRDVGRRRVLFRKGSRSSGVGFSARQYRVGSQDGREHDPGAQHRRWRCCCDAGET